MDFYDYTAKDAAGGEVEFSVYRGKVLLVVNTATGCGFTPQYEGLQDLYEKYHELGFEILDFPCNQFANQAPGTEEEIVEFCQTRFGVSFPQFAKIDVNGENELPLYTWLKEQKGFSGFTQGHPLSEIVTQVVSAMDPDFANNSKIKWNFTKFLIDRSGNVVKRYEPMEDISDIESDVKDLLNV